jgi:hypothetical protein
MFPVVLKFSTNQRGGMASDPFVPMENMNEAKAHVLFSFDKSKHSLLFPLYFISLL